MKLYTLFQQILHENIIDKKYNKYLSDDELNFVYNEPFLNWSSNWKYTIKDELGFPMKFYRGIGKFSEDPIDFNKLGKWYTPKKEYALKYAVNLDTDDFEPNNLVTVFLRGKKIINIDDYYPREGDDDFMAHDNISTKNKHINSKYLIFDYDKFLKDFNSSNVIIGKEDNIGENESYFVKNPNNVLVYNPEK
jgi:hypothetical protein